MKFMRFALNEDEESLTFYICRYWVVFWFGPIEYWRVDFTRCLDNQNPYFALTIGPLKFGKWAY